MTHATDISIVIPAFNCAAYIGATLESVFSQTLQPAEVIVVDDGSTDRLDDALRPYRDRIRVVRQANGGSAAARNTGINEARFGLIQFVDSDDVLMPTALRDQLKCMLDTGADAVYGDCVFWGGYYNGKRFTDFHPSSGRVTVDAVLARQCNIVYAVLAKRHALLEAGLFNTDMRLCEDMDFWVRMLLMGYTFAYHDRVLLRYRHQGQNKTSRELKNLMWEGAMYWRFLKMCLRPVKITARQLIHLVTMYVTAAARHVARQFVPVSFRRTSKTILHHQAGRQRPAL